MILNETRKKKLLDTFFFRMIYKIMKIEKKCKMKQNYFHYREKAIIK